MIKAGVYGATGYTGYELVRILLGHPEVEIVFLTSETYKGKTLSEVYPCGIGNRLIGSSDADPGSVDAVFTCLPHTTAMEFIRKVYRPGLKIIDLSADFRFKSAADYFEWYDVEHTAPELLEHSAYGLCEFFRPEIESCRIVGNPGCYPTSALLAVAPLAIAGFLEQDEVIVDSKSGVTGAGRKASTTSHFAEVNENILPYKIGRVHRHVGEMETVLSHFAGREMKVVFTPQLAPWSRGILSTVYVRTSKGAEKVRALYRETYSTTPFVTVLENGQPAQLAWVQHNNSCVIGVHEVAGSSYTMISSAVDNLVKGAAGQAVQNLNILFGLDETVGLAAASGRI